MSSEDVAAYLTQVGSNQRKLQYCRQIMASNVSFIPQYIFNLKSAPSTNTQSKAQFIQNIRTLGLGCNAQEEELIFGYFQIDGKSYVTYDEFLSLVVPQTDTSLKKIIANRKGEEFVFDYSLRFCMQKYFFQIIQNQVKLQLMCKFTFPKGGKDEKKRAKRLDVDNLVYFMNAHGRFPDEKTCEFIVREMGYSKWENKRNKLIVQYVLQFNDKYKHKSEPLPPVLYKDPVTIVSTMKKSEKKVEKQNKLTTNNNKKMDFSQYKPALNPLLVNNPLQDLTKQLITPPNFIKDAPNPINSISSVENRIKSLMSEVNKKCNTIESNKNSVKQEEYKTSQVKNSLVSGIKQELKKQKETKLQLRSDSNFKNIEIKKDRQTPYARISNQRFNGGQYTDRDTSRRNNDPQYDRSSRNKSDRFQYLRDKKKPQQNSQQSLSGLSQVVHKPKVNVSNPSANLHSQDKLKQFLKNSKESIKNDSNNDKIGDGKKRIQYLKSLISQKNSSQIQR